MNSTAPPSLASLAPKKRKPYARKPAPGDIVMEKGIPIPPAQHRSKYPWLALEPGDSFFVPGAPESLRHTCNAKNKKSTVQYTARSAELRGIKGIRVWRTR